jgi:hypothetical protein
MFTWRRQRQKTEAALLLQLAAGAPHRIDGKSSPDTQGCSEGREPAVPLSPAWEPLLTFLFRANFFNPASSIVQLQSVHQRYPIKRVEVTADETQRLYQAYFCHWRRNDVCAQPSSFVRVFLSIGCLPRSFHQDQRSGCGCGARD